MPCVHNGFISWQPAVIMKKVLIVDPIFRIPEIVKDMINMFILEFFKLLILVKFEKTGKTPYYNERMS